MPSAIALLEVREAQAREEPESWLEALWEAEVQAEAARQRLDHARIAREEVVRMFAEGSVPAGEGGAVSPAPVVVEEPVRVAEADRAATGWARTGSRDQLVATDGGSEQAILRPLDHPGFMGWSHAQRRVLPQVGARTRRRHHHHRQRRNRTST